MNIGDRVKFPFGGEEKEGVVVKVYPKTVYLRVDFPRHPGKIVVRSIADLEGKPLTNQKKKEKRRQEKKERKEKKEKIPPQKDEGKAE